MAASAIEHHETTEFIGLLQGHISMDRELLSKCIDALRVDNRYLFDLAKRYMTNGNEVTQTSVKDDFCSGIEFPMVGVTLDLINRFTDSGPDQLEQLLGPRWCHSTEIGLRWNYLSQEMVPLEYHDESSQAWYYFRDLSNTIGQERRFPSDLLQKDWTWRGLVIHAFACRELSAANTKYQLPQPEYLHWAGTHEDVGAVIGATKEYQTLDIRVLQSALDNNGSVHPLCEGSL